MATGNGSREGVIETVRRHKWKVLLCSGVGLLAAIGLHMMRPVKYESRAQLFVRYVMSDSKIPFTSGVVPTMSQLKEILQGMDLLRHVAVSIGPEKILRKAGGGEDVPRAVAVLQRGLTVRVPPGNGGVIPIVFRHVDSEIVQPVLTEFVNQFLRMHNESVRIQYEDELWHPEGVAVIILIQAPTPAFFDFRSVFFKPTMIFAAGLLIGLTWVLLIRRTDGRREFAS
jgi:hypothetical protein